MNSITANEGGFLTQKANDIPIEERIFVKKLIGVKATSEYYREATSVEIQEWKEYLANFKKMIAI